MFFVNCKWCLPLVCMFLSVTETSQKLFALVEYPVNFHGIIPSHWNHQKTVSSVWYLNRFNKKNLTDVTKHFLPRQIQNNSIILFLFFSAGEKEESIWHFRNRKRELNSEVVKLDNSWMYYCHAISDIYDNEHWNISWENEERNEVYIHHHSLCQNLSELLQICVGPLAKLNQLSTISACNPFCYCWWWWG